MEHPDTRRTSDPRPNPHRPFLVHFQRTLHLTRKTGPERTSRPSPFWAGSARFWIPQSAQRRRRDHFREPENQGIWQLCRISG